MGWSLDDKTEIMSLSEMIKGFSLNRVHASPAAIDFKKLDYFNGHYIRALSESELIDRISNYLQKFDSDYYQIATADQNKFTEIVRLVRERLRRFDEFTQFTQYYYLIPDINKATISEFITDEQVLTNYLHRVTSELQEISNWEVFELDPKLHQIQAEMQLKPKDAFMTLRLIVSGQHATPPLFDMLKVIGKESVIERIMHFLTTNNL
jgi:glutamyl/glutaminyl-tRNA synthetase